MAQKKVKKTKTTNKAKRVVVDHELLEKLCGQYVKPKTIIKHYKAKNKGKRNQPGQKHLESLITGIKKAQSGFYDEKNAKTKKSEDHNKSCCKPGQTCKDPPYVKAAKDTLNQTQGLPPLPPLHEVRTYQIYAERQASTAINEIVALKKALVIAEAKQSLWEKRLKTIEAFNKSKETISIIDWLLE